VRPDYKVIAVPDPAYRDTGTSPAAVSRGCLECVCASVAASGFAIVADFAAVSLVRALAVEAHRRDAAGEFHTAGVGRAAGRIARLDIRGDRICWLDGQALAPAERDWFAALEALRSELNRCTLLGLFSVEAHYAIYPPGARYAPHRDRFRDDDARVLSWVLYLNDAWKADAGGALRIYRPEGAACDVLPEGGTLACFLSEAFEHEVLPATRERLSLTGWFRRRSAP
jgi:SM-20-related protein